MTVQRGDSAVVGLRQGSDQNVGHGNRDAFAANLMSDIPNRKVRKAGCRQGLGPYGHLLENLVFTALRRLYPEIYYYKTNTGREVDFIVARRGRSRMLVQVCGSLAEPQTRKREMTALNEAMVELGLKTGIIVNRNEKERTEVEAGTITVVPIWRFLLDLPELADWPHKICC